MKDIVIINIQNFPSGMIAVFENLETVKFCKKRGVFYRYAYNTNANASAAFHDMIMDAPFNSLCDNVWYPWSKNSTASRSIFHMFRQQGFETYFFGAFGLEKDLDPHSNLLRNQSIETILESYGITHFMSHYDSAFSCHYDPKHDEKCLNSALQLLDTTSTNPRFVWINLLGCSNIAHTCTGSLCDIPRVPYFTIKQHSDALENNSLVKSCEDDPRLETSASFEIEACRRDVMLEDALKRQCLHDSDRNKTLQSFRYLVFTYFLSIDKLLHKIAILDNQYFALFSTHAIGMREHGVCEHLPWETCNRSFMTLFPFSANNVDSPVCVQSCIYYILNSMGMNTAYLHRPTLIDTSGALILGFSPSWLCKANIIPRIEAHTFRVFFIRGVFFLHSRLYAVNVWFSLHDSEGMGHFRNPIFKVTNMKDLNTISNVYVYDLTCDIDEMSNIALYEWFESDTASLLFGLLQSTSKAYDYEILHGDFDVNISIDNTRVHYLQTIVNKETPKIFTNTIGTQTDASSILVSIQPLIPTIYFPQIKAMLSSQHGSVTVLIPTKDIEVLVLTRAFTSKELVLYADNEIEVRDTFSNIFVPLKTPDDNIIIGKHKLIMRHEKCVNHFGGRSILYETIPFVGIKTLSSTPAPSSPKSDNSGTMTVTSSSYTATMQRIRSSRKFPKTQPPADLDKKNTNISSLERSRYNTRR